MLYVRDSLEDKSMCLLISILCKEKIETWLVSPARNRGGFRGGDLVTCNHLFSAMILHFKPNEGN